ncbi:MAG: hypothetical protein WAQ28_02050 [Bacteroidia bacterium]
MEQTKEKTDNVEKPTVSVKLDFFKKEIDETTVSASIHASITGDKKGIATLTRSLNSIIAHLAGREPY